MGNIAQGAARGHAATSLSLAFLPRFPAFVSTGFPPPTSRHRRSSASVTSTRSFASRKRPHPVAGRSSVVRAVSPEADTSSPAFPRPLRQSDEDGDNDAVAQATLRWVRSTVVGLNLCPWAGGAVVGGRMNVLVYPALPTEPVLSTASAVTAAAGDTTTSSGGSSSSSGRGSSGATEGIPRRFDSSGVSGGQLRSDQPAPDQRECSGRTSPRDSVGDTRWNIGEEEEDEEEGMLSPFDGLVEVAARQAEALAALRGDAAANATTLIVARPPLAEEFDDFLEVVDAVDDFLDDSGLRGTVQLATFHPRYRFEGSGEDDASNYTNRSPFPVLHLLLEDQVSAAVEQIGDPAKVWQRNVDTTRKLGVEAMRRGVEACLTAEAPRESGTGGAEDGEGGQR